MKLMNALLALSALLFTACGSSKGGSAPMANPEKTVETPASTQPTLADTLKSSAWCIAYYGVDPTNILYDIYQEERSEFLPNRIIRVDKYEITKAKFRVRHLRSSTSKWELSGNLISRTDKTGETEVGEISLLGGEKIKIVWVTGDKGLVYEKCQ